METTLRAGASRSDGLRGYCLSPRRPGYWFAASVIASAYAAAAKFGISLPVADGVITPVWAPTGIALAALLLLGLPPLAGGGARRLPRQRHKRRFARPGSRHLSWQHVRSHRWRLPSPPLSLRSQVRPGPRRAPLRGSRGEGRVSATGTPKRKLLGTRRDGPVGHIPDLCHGVLDLGREGL